MRAGDSSSPSGSDPSDDSIGVASVTSRGNAVRVIFTDGSSLDLDPETRYRYSLEPGCRLRPEVLCSIREDAETLEAESRAVGLLSRSRHTRQGLRLKLERRGYAPAVIGRVLGRLSDLGYLDDARTAEGWLRNRIERHPEGRAALLAGLLRHGVSRELAQCAVDTCLPAEAEEEVARRFLDKLYPDPATRSLWGEAERAKALRRLQARGFSHSAARRALGSPED